VITDSAPEAWGATPQLVKDDKFFNPEKEIRRLKMEGYFAQ
jgi:hypothetical protein